jgi:hypothetical protein
MDAEERAGTVSKAEETLALKERMGFTQSYISQTKHPEARLTLGTL